MNKKQEQLQRICCGNAAGVDFMNRWQAYVHAIDDIEDGELTHPEERLGTFIGALELYTHPFFLRYMAELKPVILLVTSDYADAVAWEKSKTEWKRREADTLRHSGAAMVRIVAYLCAEAHTPGSGYRHLRSFSLEMRTVCYLEHHDEKGQPV